MVNVIDRSRATEVPDLLNDLVSGLYPDHVDRYALDVAWASGVACPVAVRRGDFVLSPDVVSWLRSPWRTV